MELTETYVESLPVKGKAWIVSVSVDDRWCGRSNAQVLIHEVQKRGGRNEGRVGFPKNAERDERD